MPAVQKDYGNLKPGLPMERDGKAYYRQRFTNDIVAVLDEDHKLVGRVRGGDHMTDDELLDRVLGRSHS